SVNASIRRAERAATKRHRELQAMQKRQDKMMARMQAEFEVETYNNFMERIVSLHHDCSEPMNWRDFQSAPEPEKPQKVTKLEGAARLAFENYVPWLVTRWLKLDGWRRRALERKITEAMNKEEAEF